MSVWNYLVAGVVCAFVYLVCTFLEEKEKQPTPYLLFGMVLFLFLIWPVWALVQVAGVTAGVISARRSASKHKPEEPPAPDPFPPSSYPHARRFLSCPRCQTDEAPPGEDGSGVTYEHLSEMSLDVSVECWACGERSDASDWLEFNEEKVKVCRREEREAKAARMVNATPL